MLVEFRVKNYRSLRDEQVFSFVAAKDTFLEETNVHETGVDAVPRLLRSSVVYGANASGKSNLIQAFGLVRAVVANSVKDIFSGWDYDVQPFRLERDSASSPTEFEVTVLIDGVRYEYGFSMKPNQILSEQLRVFKKSKPQNWFKRKFDQKSGKDIYQFGNGLTGPKKVWQEATTPNALFLSVASMLNSSDVKPLFDWFVGKFQVYRQFHVYDGHSSLKSPLQDTIDYIADADNKRTVLNLLKSSDIHIDDIEVLDGLDSPEEKRVRFHRSGKVKNVAFDFDVESGGTKGLFAMAGPLLEILETGKTVVVDELGINLHPLLLIKLIRIFHDPKTNIGNAQLIFSTHDATLLRPLNLFRRDQVWFTDKGGDQATELVSIAEYSPRKTENLERYYLDGRYGGVPFLDNEIELSG